jgi:hypothetical protein
MSTIAYMKRQLDRIWYASVQTDLTDTLSECVTPSVRKAAHS